MLDTDIPDKFSIITYVSQFYHLLKDEDNSRLVTMHFAFWWLNLFFVLSISLNYRNVLINAIYLRSPSLPIKEMNINNSYDSSDSSPQVEMIKFWNIWKIVSLSVKYYKGLVLLA